MIASKGAEAMLPGVRSTPAFRSRRAEGMTVEACARTAAVTALALAALWGDRLHGVHRRGRGG